MTAVAARERPESAAQAGELLAALGADGRPVRVRGGDTKRSWDGSLAGAVELETGGLHRILEHNAGDFTAVLEAGVRLADAQQVFAERGQMLALDPPVAADPGPQAWIGEATIGGVLAAGDSGPLRQRYGSGRDLVLGIRVALSDGTVAHAGGRVIKNVAGYDLGKLFCGSGGTLGLICEVAVRLHPRPVATATLRAECGEAAALAGAAAQMASLPLEADCLDVAWSAGSGTLLVRFGGTTARERAESALERLPPAGLGDASVVEDDEALWQGQRAGQRRPRGAVLRVSGVIADLRRVLDAADAVGATVVSRAGLGLSWLALEEPGRVAEGVEDLRRRLPGTGVTVLDGAGLVARPQPAPPSAAAAVMARLKERFDPAGIFPRGGWSA